MRGGTTPRTRSRSEVKSPNRSTNTSSPPQKYSIKNYRYVS